MSAYEPKPYEIAGFDLYGERQPDGSIKLGAHALDRPDERTHLPEFPPEVEVCGAVYTLEEVKENEIRDVTRERSSPETIAHAERIVWGIYV